MNRQAQLKKPMTIIMADDDEDDRLLAQDAMQASGANCLCHTVNDGQELLDYLRCEGKYADNDVADLPSVILLDLNMPILDGRETLKQLKSDPHLSKIPVVILSTSNDELDINSSYSLGASSYMVKPNNFGSLVDLMSCFNNYWFDFATIPYVESKKR